MAYTATNIAGSALAERVSNFRARWADTRKRRAAYYRSLHELAALSDRELHDLGLSRSGLSSIARETAGL